MILVDLVGVGAARPDRPLFDGLSLTIRAADRLGVVGINGTGKSTLLRVVAGVDEPESGTARFGSGVRIGVLEQEPRLDGSTVHDAAGGSWQSDAVLDRLGMGAHLERPIGELSGGQVKRVALARALSGEHDLLVLDEPTNHLDIDAIAWLEDRLARFAGGLVMVTHDRHVLDRVTTKVLELDRGRPYLHEGGYDAYLDGRAERAARDEQAERARRNLARRELAWLRRGAPARTSKPKARIEAAIETVEARPAAEARTGDLPLHFGTPRLGSKVVELGGIGHRFDGRQWLYRDLDLLLDPRERLGVVGPNGAGKSTLLDLIAGRLSPTEGSVELGSTVRLGYFDQRGRTLDPDARVRDLVAGPHGPPDHRDETLMAAFWFDGDAQRAQVRTLSGGERRRLQLLLTLAERPNVLLLDEPTNDLDLDTLRSLEDFLETWPGALIVASHDRAFLERTTSDVLVVEAGTAGRRPGGIAAYEADRRAAPRRRGSVASDAPASDASTASTAPTASTSGGRAPASSASLPSPSTLRHRLREVERRQATLRAQVTGLEAEVAEATTDHVRLAAVAADLAAAQRDLDELDEEWLELATAAEGRGLTLD